MRHVPISEFETNISEFVAAARGGEEIVVTREGREELRLVMADMAKMERQRAAVEAMYALGQEVLARNGPTTAAERRAWIEDGRP
jgi:prevent-host-death family protein